MGERRCGRSIEFDDKKNKCMSSDIFGEQKSVCVCNKEKSDSGKACNGADTSVKMSLMALFLSASFKLLF